MFRIKVQSQRQYRPCEPISSDFSRTRNLEGSPRFFFHSASSQGRTLNSTTKPSFSIACAIKNHLQYIHVSVPSVCTIRCRVEFPFDASPTCGYGVPLTPLRRTDQRKTKRKRIERYSSTVHRDRDCYPSSTLT